MHWRVIFDDTTYPTWLRPNSKAKKPSNWRKEKIIDRLWKAKITIMPPDPIPHLLLPKAELPKLKSAKRTKSTPLTATQVRTAREVKGWNQRELATLLGVSQKLVSMIERGERTITPKLETKLIKVLEI
jgi:DNA-binding XRE family transcriptional regulator